MNMRNTQYRPTAGNTINDLSQFPEAIERVR